MLMLMFFAQRVLTVTLCKTLVLSDHWELDIKVARVVFVLSLASTRMPGLVAASANNETGRPLQRVECSLLSNCSAAFSQAVVGYPPLQANLQSGASAPHLNISNLQPAAQS